MPDDSRDPIIDAGLEEVLGGVAPPDLTSGILKALEGSSKAAARVETDSPAVPLRPQPTSARYGRAKPSASSRQRLGPWLAVAVCLAVAMIGSAVPWSIFKSGSQPQQPSNPIAKSNQQTPSNVVSSNSLPSVEVADKDTGPTEDLPEPSQTQPPAAMIASESPLIPSVDEQNGVVPVVIPDERPSPLPDEQMVHAINELIRDRWSAEGITSVDVAGDDHWCKRVFTKLIGREPTADESNLFRANRSATKREELVDLLLKGDTYVEEFAAHWSRKWTDILISTGTGRSERDGLEQFLRRAFADGKPLDHTVDELLTANGSTAIGTAGYNGATNYLVAHTSRDGVHANATAHVSRTFMAFSMECSQCHVDATWSGVEQQQFWELNAFLRQVDVQRDGDRGLILSDAVSTSRGSPSAGGEVFFDTPDGRLKSALPVFVDGTAISSNPDPEKVNRRKMLAKFVTRSEQFRQAMANRFWYELFGVGFTIPPDNIGPHNPPSHPELLSKLGAQFAAHNYDVRALIRWIALSEPFALSADHVITDDQVRGKLVFDRFPTASKPREAALPQLRIAEEVYASVRESSGNLGIPARVVAPTPGTIPMQLSDVDKLLASVAVEAKRLSTSTVYGNVILSSDLSSEQKILHMFYATLHRAPTTAERKAVARLLEDESTSVDDEGAWRYVWWALASSKEAL